MVCRTCFVVACFFANLKQISEWILLGLAYAFVGARIFTRLFRLHQRLDASDWLLIASALDALGLIICDTLTFQMGVLDDYEESEKLSKISFASNYFYDVGMGFPKLSMLAFYWAYFPLADRRGLRWLLWGATGFVVACYTTILLDDTLFCGSDVSVQWSQEKGACSVFYAPEPFILNFTLNLACYLVGTRPRYYQMSEKLRTELTQLVLVYVVPVVYLMRGILARSSGVTMTFVLGFFTIASGVVRFACLKAGTGQENLVCKSIFLRIVVSNMSQILTVPVDPLSMVEMTLSIIVVSLPGLKPLLKKQSRSCEEEPSTPETYDNKEAAVGK